jgi:hypothetical protein
MRNPDDTPLRDGTRDRTIGLLTQRCALSKYGVVLPTKFRLKFLEKKNWKRSIQYITPATSDSLGDQRYL